jgi:cardiolipin synthase A/B
VHFSYWTIFWGSIYALDLFAIGRALLRGHGVAGTFAWILAILLFPMVGAASYLVLANPSIRLTTKRKRRRTIELRSVKLGNGDGSLVPTVEGDASSSDRSLLALTSALTGLPPSTGNNVTLLTENVHAFEAIERALREARRSIWAEFYLVRSDDTGRRFLQILAERAAEGLEVRLLYDAFGSLGIDSSLIRAIRKAGGRAESFLPMNPLRRRWSVHLRNHRKLLVLDGEKGFTGGANIANEYSGRARRRGTSPWRDAHLSIAGPAVHDLAQIFAEDWLFATEEPILPPHRPRPEAGGSVAAIVPSGPDQEVNANALLYFTGITSARDRCYITSPYFVPDDPIVAALQSAALRGVDVRLLVPAKSDVPICTHVGRSYYRPLVRAGVQVYEYQPSMLHAKTMVVDGSWGMVSSANLDMRSFWLNFEVGALVCDPLFARALEGRYLKDLESSVEITEETVANWPLLKRLLLGAARLLSPLL